MADHIIGNIVGQNTLFSPKSKQLSNIVKDNSNDFVNLMGRLRETFAEVTGRMEEKFPGVYAVNPQSLASLQIKDISSSFPPFIES